MQWQKSYQILFVIRSMAIDEYQHLVNNRFYDHIQHYKIMNYHKMIIIFFKYLKIKYFYLEE